MKNLLIILSLSLLASCGVKKEYKKELSIAPEVQAYVSQFEKFNGKKIDDLKVSFANMSMSLGGYCQVSRTVEKKAMKEIITETPKIFINPENWRMFTPAQREMLMFHELGHCILNRDHNDNNMKVVINGKEEKAQASIMNSYIFGDYVSSGSMMGYGAYLGDYYSYYMSELFSKPIDQYQSFAFTESVYNNLSASVASFFGAVNESNLETTKIDTNQKFVQEHELHDGCVENLGTTYIDNAENEDTSGNQ